MQFLADIGSNRFGLIRAIRVIGGSMFFLCAFMLVRSLTSAAQPPPNPRVLPRPEKVAETRLLMDALNQTNFEGLERLLHEKPATTDAWIFLRGQALLIAECGNLLMIRPPTVGRAVWLDRCADLRTAAARVARAAADRDYFRAKNLVGELATSCNRCHDTFRIKVRIPLVPAAPREGPVPHP
jgi:hypothetical protein